MSRVTREWAPITLCAPIETPRSNLYKKLESYTIDKEKDGQP